MKLALSLTLLTAACATTNTLDHEPAPQRAKVRLDLSTSAEEHAVFPALQAPRLPRVDRIARQVRAQLGAEALVSIELCVAADGHVTGVSLLAGTGYEPFDAAVIRDIEQWRFASMPGTSVVKTLQTCERAKVKYLAPQ